MPEKKNHELLDKLLELEAQIEAALQEQKAHIAYEIKHGKAIFSEEIRKLQKQELRPIIRFLRATPWRMFATAPIIYGLIVPAVLLDACVTLYQVTCFPVYRIQKVKRRDHIALDRHRLEYLNIIEKFNCLYCGYMNGVFSYASEVAGRTEQFFCPIKHARRIKHPHARYRNFLEYGAFEHYAKEVQRLRSKLHHIDKA